MIFETVIVDDRKKSEVVLAWFKTNLCDRPKRILARQATSPTVNNASAVISNICQIQVNERYLRVSMSRSLLASFMMESLMN